MLDDLDKMIDGEFLCYWIDCQLFKEESSFEIVIGRKNVDRKCFVCYRHKFVFLSRFHALELLKILHHRLCFHVSLRIE